MYAIVNIAGQHFKVEKDQTIIVNRLAEEEGKQVTFKEVLLSDDGGKIKMGAPIKGASVSAKVIAHVRGDKVLVFKKKRRKGYRKMNGHRQDLTRIQIESISI
jgi:large subunit ribosomal protein L21